MIFFRLSNGLDMWAAWAGLFNLEQSLKYNNNNIAIDKILCFSRKVIIEVCDGHVEKVSFIFIF